MTAAAGVLACQAAQKAQLVCIAPHVYVSCGCLRLQYKMPGTTGDQKHLLAWNIIREVSLHSCKEEEVRQQHWLQL
jgi:hypothetical protein